MRRSFLILALWTLAAAIPTSPASGQQANELKPPFNTYWGLTKEKLLLNIEGAKAKVVQTRNVNGREALTVEGLLFPKLKRVIFFFSEGALNEVELQYGEDYWDSSGYNEFFDNWRRTLESKYGIGRLITRTRKRDGETLVTIIGYQWAQVGTTLQLYYFSADKGADGFRIVSLHYRGS